MSFELGVNPPSNLFIPGKSSLPCPEEDFFVNPNDCSSFYRCVNQGSESLTAFEFSCPAGLVFDEELRVCNWPYAVKDKCINGKPSSPRAGRTQPDEENGVGPSNESGRPGGGRNKPVKRKRCKSEGFFRDEKVCGKFYRCVAGENGGFFEYKFICPGGLAFDERNSVCNWPNEVPGCGAKESVSPGRSNEEQPPTDDSESPRYPPAPGKLPRRPPTSPKGTKRPASSQGKPRQPPSPSQRRTKPPSTPSARGQQRPPSRKPEQDEPGKRPPVKEKGARPTGKPGKGSGQPESKPDQGKGSRPESKPDQGKGSRPESKPTASRPKTPVRQPTKPPAKMEKGTRPTGRPESRPPTTTPAGVKQTKPAPTTTVSPPSSVKEMGKRPTQKPESLVTPSPGSDKKPKTTAKPSQGKLS